MSDFTLFLKSFLKSKLQDRASYVVEKYFIKSVLACTHSKYSDKLYSVSDLSLPLSDMSSNNRAVKWTQVWYVSMEFNKMKQIYTFMIVNRQDSLL